MTLAPVELLAWADRVARSIVGAADTDAVLRETVKGARELTGACYAAIALYDYAGRIVRWVHSGVSDEVAAAIGEPPIGRGLLGALQEVDAIRLDDLQADPRFRGFPRRHPEMRSFLGTPIEVAAGLTGRIYLAEKQGDGGFTEADEAAIRTMASYVTLALHHTSITARLEQQNKYLQAYQEAARLITTSLDFRTIVGAVTSGAAAAFDADFALLQVEDAPAGLTRVVSAHGASNLEGLTLNSQGTVFGRVIGSGMPSFVADVRAEAHDSMLHLFPRPPISALYAPIRSRSGLRGTLSILFAREIVPAASLQDAFYALADLGAAALDNARAMERERELALLQDRERIAMDLHDTTLQEIYAAMLHLEIAEGAVANDPERVTATLATVRERLTHLNKSIRGYLGSLSLSSPGGYAGLHDLLAGVVDDVGKLLGVETRWANEAGDVPVAPGLDVASLSLLAREALVNAHKHAHASTVSLTLSAVPEGFAIVVLDDGDGFDIGEAEAKGHCGLRNMRERAVGIGATLAIETRPGEGARLEILLPRDRSRESSDRTRRTI